MEGGGDHRLGIYKTDRGQEREAVSVTRYRGRATRGTLKDRELGVKDAFLDSWPATSKTKSGSEALSRGGNGYEAFGTSATPGMAGCHGRQACSEHQAKRLGPEMMPFLAGFSDKGSSASKWEHGPRPSLPRLPLSLQLGEQRPTYRHQSGEPCRRP